MYYVFNKLHNIPLLLLDGIISIPNTLNRKLCMNIIAIHKTFLYFLVFLLLLFNRSQLSDIKACDVAPATPLPRNVYEGVNPLYNCL